VASEYRTLFAFYRDELEVTDGQEVRVAEFGDCLAVMFGFPGDEVLGGHRLWGRGLAYYAIHEVLESAWLEEMRAIERRHIHAPTAPFADVKHYVLTFYDTTLEALARQLRPVSTHSTMAEAISTMAAALWRRTPDLERWL
jgi:hypothetical protein